MKEDFYRAIISERDFEEAADYLLALTESGPAIVRKALLVAAVIAYGRPFTRNEREKGAKASAKVSLLIENLLNDQEREMHGRLIELRNKAIAHSEFAVNPVSLGEVTEGGLSFKATSFDILDESIDVPTFISLCRKRAKQAMDTGFAAAQAETKAQNAL